MHFVHRSVYLYLLTCISFAFLFITGLPTHSVGRPVLFCSLASVVVCNTARRASSVTSR